jgi:hypothetical protein
MTRNQIFYMRNFFRAIHDASTGIFDTKRNNLDEEKRAFGDYYCDSTMASMFTSKLFVQIGRF